MQENTENKRKRWRATEQWLLSTKCERALTYLEMVVIFDAKLFAFEHRGISTGIRDADNLRCKTCCAFDSEKR